MKSLTIWVLILSALSVAPVPSFAAKQDFTYEKNKFSFNMPDKWEDLQDMFGVPVSLLGPMENEDQGRPVVLVTPVGPNFIKFDSESLNKSQKEYQSGRQEWVKKFADGKILSFSPYKEESWGNLKVHSIGHKYFALNTEYDEMSYYITCKDQLFHIKSLLRSEHGKYVDQTKDLIKSFNCGE